MGRIGGALVCLLIVMMDIVAGVLGIQAEIAQNKVHHLKFLVFECKEPSAQAFRLGLAAAALLALAHVTANMLGGCLCIFSKEEFAQSSANRQLAIVCLLVSWIVLVVGFAMLIIGAMYNNKSRTSCGLSHHSFLSIGGILCFVHGLFCAAYYVSANATTGEEDKPRRRTGAQMT